MNQEELCVYQFLKDNDFNPSRVSEDDEEKADFLAFDAVDAYVVEVKGKDLPNDYQEFIEKSAIEGQSSLTRRLESLNRIDSIVKKAESQLVNTQAPERALRLLWVLCLNRDADFILDQFKVRLYGMQELAIISQIESSNKVSALPCFYYGYSSFFRFHRIDAAVLLSVEGAYFCVNEFSKNLLRTA